MLFSLNRYAGWATLAIWLLLQGSFQTVARAERRWRAGQASPRSTAAEGNAPILQHSLRLQLTDDIIMECLLHFGDYQPFCDTEGRLIVVVHSFFSSVITPFRICLTLPDWSSNLLCWKTSYFLSWRAKACCTPADVVCHAARLWSCFFPLYLPLAGSFLWSALRTVHHGRSSRPTDVEQLLSGSISLCWHWGTHQRCRQTV